MEHLLRALYRLSVSLQLLQGAFYSPQFAHKETKTEMILTPEPRFLLSSLAVSSWASILPLNALISLSVQRRKQ